MTRHIRFWTAAAVAFLTACSAATTPPAANPPPQATVAPTVVPAIQNTTAPKPTTSSVGQATTAPAASGLSTKPLRIAATDAPSSLDPATLFGNQSLEVVQNLLDGLTAVTNDLKVVPAIGKSWDVSPDGSVYTFHLRDDVTFSNGDKVTADDFKYSWNRVADPKLASPEGFLLSVVKGAQDVMDGKATDISGVVVKDPSTLEVTLAQPAGYFPQLVSMMAYTVVDRKVIEKFGDQWTAPGNFVGTGAYLLRDYKPDQSIVLEANPTYFGQKASIQRVEIQIIKDATTQELKFEAGEIDAMTNLSAPDVVRIKADPTLSKAFHQTPLLGITWLGMRYTVAPFDKKAVREAFNYAIDKDRVIQVATAGVGQPAYSFLPPALPGFDPNLKPYTFDAAKAKAKLVEAGLGNTASFPSLKLDFPTSTVNQKVVEEVQQQLKTNLGINVTLEGLERKDYNAMFNSPSTRPTLYRQSFTLDYPDAQEPLTFLVMCGSRQNKEEFCSQEVDQLIKQGNGSSDQAKREAAYKEAARLYMESAPIVPLYYDVQTSLVAAGVRNWGWGPSLMDRLNLASWQS
jgi:ABC-type oligopeptide transport system substrate-binding subunit